MPELPASVAALFDSGAPFEIIKNDEFSCYITTVGLELRFVLSDDKGWEFDEVVGKCSVHFEQMDSNWYWVGLQTDQGFIHLHIGAKRADVKMTGSSEMLV